MSILTSICPQYSMFNFIQIKNLTTNFISMDFPKSRDLFNRLNQELSIKAGKFVIFYPYLHWRLWNFTITNGSLINHCMNC